MAPILTAEDVVRRIAAEWAYVDERGGVGIRPEAAAAIVRQYGEQFRRVARRRQRRRPAKPPPPCEGPFPLLLGPQGTLWGTIVRKGGMDSPPRNCSRPSDRNRFPRPA
jgi:hypothetical protein